MLHDFAQHSRHPDARPAVKSPLHVAPSGISIEAKRLKNRIFRLSMEIFRRNCDCAARLASRCIVSKRNNTPLHLDAPCLHQRSTRTLMVSVSNRGVVMPYAILRTKKLKTIAGVLGSGRHTFREMPTPNSDGAPGVHICGATNSLNWVGQS